MTCENCGAENSKNRKTCWFCDADLVDDMEASVPVQAKWKLWGFVFLVMAISASITFFYVQFQIQTRENLL
jgi:hypothetical protein